MSAGSRFKGTNKGNVTFGGTNIVETVDGQNAIAGSEFDGDQIGTLNFNENNTVKNVIPAGKQDNIDTPTGTSTSSQVKPQVAKVQPLQSIPRVGSTVIVEPISDGNKNGGTYTANIGSFVTAKKIHSKIEDKIFYRGGVPGSVMTMNLPSNWESHTNIGSVTRVEEVGGGVDFNADIHINGHVTVFNQEFKNTPTFRNGSANDVEYLKRTFKRFGIEPAVRLDLQYKDIVKEIKTLSNTDFTGYKLFVCIFMSHGHGNGIVCAADKEFKLKPTIIDPIMENSTLNGILKIFITVACRGSGNYEEFDMEEFDGHILSTADGIDYSNYIISYSTYEGHVSKRTREGTYFIQYLCDNINEDNGETKIHSIFAEVNGKLAKMYKQVPVFETTMGNICFKDLASAPN